MKTFVWGLMIMVMMVCGISTTVKAAAINESEQISREEYKKMEEECVNHIKILLEEKGCKDAGVSLTYVTNDDVLREYTVVIHHKNIDRMSQDERLILIDRMREEAEEILLSKTKVKIF